MSGNVNHDFKVRSKPTEVGDLFFSDYNIRILHEAIRYRVWVESGKAILIGRQSNDELSIVMRSVYLTDAKNVDGPTHIVVGQVRELNTLVLDYCVPQIVREGETYLQYKRDASRLPVPLDRGQIATTKGDNSLDMSRLYTYT
jgi:hypothetical protein